MKNTKYLYLFSLIISLFLFCSFSRNNIKTVNGYIHVYGNDPFAYIGIITEDNKEYAIEAEEDEITKLWKTQGTKIELKGTIIKSKKNILEAKMLKDGKIELAEWRVLE